MPPISSTWPTGFPSFTLPERQQEDMPTFDDGVDILVCIKEFGVEIFDGWE